MFFYIYYLDKKKKKKNELVFYYRLDNFRSESVILSSVIPSGLFGVNFSRKLSPPGIADVNLKVIVVRVSLQKRRLTRVEMLNSVRIFAYVTRHREVGGGTDDRAAAVLKVLLRARALCDERIIDLLD